jgi:hypothetical protein
VRETADMTTKIKERLTWARRFSPDEKRKNFVKKEVEKKEMKERNTAQNINQSK